MNLFEGKKFLKIIKQLMIIITFSGQYDYDEVIRKSILFYEAQRSGKLPANNRIPYRGDSALGDKGLSNEDLSGGWYDGKYAFYYYY